MNRDDRRALQNEFRDALVENCLDKARDWEDLAYYAREVIAIHKAWELPVGHENEILEKINGAIRKCSNKMFKGANASAAGSVICRAMDAVQAEYRKKHGLDDDPVIAQIQKRIKTTS